MNEIISKETLAPDIKRIVVQNPLVANKALAGHFVVIIVDEKGERIPLTIVGSDKTKVTGAIVSTSDLTGELEFINKKQFQGVKRYIIEGEMSGDELINLLNKFPKAFFGLTFNVEKENIILKIKAKAPKSGKPGKGDEEVKADFCSLKTTDKKIAENFIFEKPDFKTAKIIHTFLIDKIIMPEGEKDFAKIREMAKRGGKIVRKAEIDGNTSTKEIEFEA